MLDSGSPSTSRARTRYISQWYSNVAASAGAPSSSFAYWPFGSPLILLLRILGAPLQPPSVWLRPQVYPALHSPSAFSPHRHCCSWGNTESFKTTQGSRLCVFDHLRIRPLVGAKLFRGKGMAASAASPIRIGSQRIPCARTELAVSTGMEHHHQFPAAFQTQSLGHTYVLSQARPYF